MTEFSIIGADEDFYTRPCDIPAYYCDLNLDQVFSAIAGTKKKYDLKRFYFLMPVNIEITRLRQGVLKALENKELYNTFNMYSESMSRVRTLFEAESSSNSEIQRLKLHLDSAAVYTHAVNELTYNLNLYLQKRNGLDDDSGDRCLLKLAEYLNSYTSSDYYMKLNSSASELLCDFQNLRLEVKFMRDRLTVATVDTEEEDYIGKIKALLNKRSELMGEDVKTEEAVINNPFTGTMELTDYELVLAELAERNKPELFNELHEFKSNHDLFTEDWLLRLEYEVQFYLAYIDFEEKLHKSGFTFCNPYISEEKTFSINNGYDLALALKSMYSAQKIIPNDTVYNNKERFLVVTGPNQGGKTTYARSLGQTVYFACLGLHVPADKAEIIWTDEILTHFSVEESLDTGRGKLKEELTRLRPMMEKTFDKEKQPPYIIINELFTTAASYDALIMGNRVIRHFIDDGCYGIYVTHIQELAGNNEGVVSIVAGVNDSDNHVRTYKMERRQAEGIGYANGLVEKYHLTYKELKERLNKIESGVI